MGLALVVVFMAVYYRKSGLIADVALILNGVLILAGLALFNATLTLPGIAGFVLTLGIAVDANVLINERVREELANGKSARAAVDQGYDRAFWTIFDAHVTTLIAGFILLSTGTGPVRGFATSLIIGLVASLFTSIVVTRVDHHLLRPRAQRPDGLGLNAMQILKHKTNIDFIGKRKPALFISSVLNLAILVGIAIFGFNFGVDFAGGTVVELKFDHPVRADEVRARAQAAGLHDVSVQGIGSAEREQLPAPARRRHPAHRGERGHRPKAPRGAGRRSATSTPTCTTASSTSAPRRSWTPTRVQAGGRRHRGPG